jgi:hypothetical protein
MSKKHFIALADFIRDRLDIVFDAKSIIALADFCQSQNPRFNRRRWLGYIGGANGPNGGEIKKPRHHVRD